MNTLWKRIKLSEKEYKEMLVSSHVLRSRLTQFIDAEIASLEAVRDYDKQNWSLHEADRKGQVHSLKLIKKLIESETLSMTTIKED
jgi:hypothetical protein